MASEQSITVRLRAVITEYQRAMKQASGDTSAFSRAAQGDFEKLGGQLNKLGDTATRKVTVPLTAIGVGALKLGADFETVFSQIVGLAGVATDEIDGLREGVLSLAGATGRSPVELAEALYYITSSGIDASQALEVLEVSAKASAAGLGDTVAIADAVTSAINAYGAENITAAQATDILVAAVREGKAEASELAPVMGRLIPLGAKLGISFDDIAGVLAVMSRTGLDAAEASTALNAVFSTLLGTTKEGEQILADHGLSLAQLRNVAAGPDGIIEVMRLLDDAFGGNLETLEQVIPNIRALRGFMNVLAQDGALVDEVMTNVSNSTGATGDAFDAFATTDAAKLKRSWADIQVALIRVGEVLLPVAGHIGSFIGMLSEGFGALPQPLQEIIVLFGVLVAAVGPALKIGGALLDNYKLIRSAVSRAFDAMAISAYNAAGAMSTVTAATAGVALVVGALTYAWMQSKAAAAQHKADLKDIEAAYWANDEALQHITDSTQKYILEQSRFHDRNQVDDLDRIGVSVKQLNEYLGQTDGFAKFAAAAVANGEVTEAATEKLGSLYDAQGDYIGSTTEAVKINGKWYMGNTDLLKSFQREQELIEETAKKRLTAAFATGELTDEVEQQIKAELDASDSTTKYTEATLQHADALAAAGIEVDNLTQDYTSMSDSAADAAKTQKALADAIDATFQAMFGERLMTESINSAFTDFNQSMEDTSDSGARAGRSIDLVAEKQKALDDATRDVERAFESLGSAFDSIERANQRLEDSYNDIEDAQQRVVDAQRDLDDALKGPSERDTGEAKAAQTRAELNLADAREKLAEAQTALADAEASGDPDAIADARRELTRAELDQQDATWRLEDATRAYNDIANWSAETDQKVAKARNGVTEAQERLQEATRQQVERQKELDRATHDAAKRYTALLEAQQAQADVQSASLASFGPANEAMAGHRAQVDATKDSYLRLAETIKDITTEIIASNLGDPNKSLGEIDKIIAQIKANPFLTPEQKQELLAFAYTQKATAIGLTPGFAGYFDDGGVIGGGRIGQEVNIKAHVGETVLPTHKTPLDKIMSAGMFAAAMQSATAPSSRGLVIEHATFGDRRVVRDLDFWARAQGAAV
jgi:TP901 family phage tail tape measure protein